MEEKLYSGVDVSQRTLDLAYYDGDTVDWKNGHIRVSNDSKGFKEIDKWLKKLKLKHDEILLTMEYTGLYSQNFRLWLEQSGIHYYMVNPRKMHRFEPDLDDGARALDRVKTDEMDSFRIAIYCEQNRKMIKRNPSHLPAESYFKLKRLIAERKQYVKQSVLYKQQLHDISIYDTEPSQERKREQLGHIQTAIDNLDHEIDLIVADDPAIKKNYDLLRSVTAIGRVIALETIILTENFTAIDNPRKYACFIGIAPFKKESGDTVRGATRVSAKGFSQAKADLSIAVLSAIRNDPNIKAYWQRKRAEKKGGIVLNAIKFKLVLRMFAVIKRQTPFVNMDTYKN